MLFGNGAIHRLFGKCLETRIVAQRFEPSIDLDAAEDAGIERLAIFVLSWESWRRRGMARRPVRNSSKAESDTTSAATPRVRLFA